MRTKLVVLIIAAVALVGSVYLIWPEWFGFCEKIKTVTRGEICRAPYATSIGQPLFPFVLALFVLSVFGLMTRRLTFRRWLRFTIIFGIIAAILMALAIAAEIDVGMITWRLFDIEKVAWFLASIYGVISLGILGISEFLVRRRR